MSDGSDETMRSYSIGEIFFHADARCTTRTASEARVVTPASQFLGKALGQSVTVGDDRSGTCPAEHERGTGSVCGHDRNSTSHRFEICQTEALLERSGGKYVRPLVQPDQIIAGHWAVDLHHGFQAEIPD
jgi:hypothetical protein